MDENSAKYYEFKPRFVDGEMMLSNYPEHVFRLVTGEKAIWLRSLQTYHLAPQCRTLIHADMSMTLTSKEWIKEVNLDKLKGLDEMVTVNGGWHVRDCNFGYLFSNEIPIPYRWMKLSETTMRRRLTLFSDL